MKVIKNSYFAFTLIKAIKALTVWGTSLLMGACLYCMDSKKIDEKLFLSHQTKTTDTMYAQTHNKHAQELQQGDKQRVFCYNSHFEDARIKHLQKLQTTSWGGVTKKYLKELNDQEEELWAQFFSYTNLTPSHMSELIKKHEQEYIKDDAQKIALLKQNTFSYKIPAEFQKHVAQVCVLFGIKSKEVEALYNEDKDNTYNVTRATIQANKLGMSFYDSSLSNALNLSEENVKGALTHEIWHILYQDRYLEWLAENIFTSHLKPVCSVEVYKQFCVKFHHFVERRADILAGLQDIYYCTGWISFLEKVVEGGRKKNLNIDSPLHPPFQERVNYLTTLKKEMLQAIEKKK